MIPLSSMNAVKNTLDLSPAGDAMGALGAFVGLGDDQNSNTVQLPGVGASAVCDELDATLVFVLPKGAGGQPDKESDDEEDSEKSLVEVSEPDEMASRVFRRKEDFMLGDLTTSQAAYQQIVRNALRDVITRTCGFQLSSFDSVDGHREFWKVSTTKEHLQRLAEKFSYAMPHSKEAYESVGVEPPMVYDAPMFAYGKFSKDRAEDFQEFLSKDEVRLVVLELQSHVHMHELEKQGIIERWFPAAKHQEIQTLAGEVVGWPFGKFRLFPTDAEVDLVQSYFGEEVAVFFTYYCTLVHSKKVVAVMGFLVLCLYWFRPAGLPLGLMNTIYSGYGCLVIIWASIFLANVEYEVEKDRCRWGAREQIQNEVQMSDYEPKLRGSMKQKVYAVAGKIITLLFLILVMVSCSTVALKIPNRKVSTMVQTAVTFFYSFLWGKIAKQIVVFENKRTQERFNQSLTMRLFFVKMFIFFFPLVRLAFIAPVNARHCGPIDAVAPLYFNETTNNLEALGITNSSDPLFVDWMNDAQLIEPKKFVNYMLLYVTSYTDIMEETVSGEKKPSDHDSAQTCFRGCYPQKCEVQENDGKLHCESTCFTTLQRSLNSLYITHILCSLVFVAVPMILVRRGVKKELAEAGEDKPYTFLQYQEKCHMEAAYEYESWGGSPVEDQLEVVLGFAVLVCFSSVSPYMAIFGMFAQVMEYRLLAYRMTWVTCRPYPSSSEGLREWLSILDVIMYVAIGMNSLLLISVMKTRLDACNIQMKLLVILLLTLGLTAVKVFVRCSLVEHPTVYVDAMDQNHEFCEALALKKGSSAPPSPAVADKQDARTLVRAGLAKP